MTFQNRIMRLGLEPIDSVLFHPDNWRIHPVRQQDGVKGSLKKVGWVEPVLINLRTGEEWGKDRNVAVLLDGHLRVTLAAREQEKAVPAIYIDVGPEEERFILSTLDPLGSLGVTDSTKLLAIVANLNKDHDTIKAAMRGAGIDLRETFSHILAAPEKDALEEIQSETGDLPDPANGAQDPGSVGQKKDKKATGAGEKYPLAVVLDRYYYELWLDYKTRSNISSDTAALKTLLDKATEIILEE